MSDAQRELRQSSGGLLAYGGVDLELRAADADLDRAAAVLGGALATGRLTSAEHAERLDAVYAAKTMEDLATLARDLPAEDRADAGTIDVGRAEVAARFSKVIRSGRWVAGRRTRLGADDPAGAAAAMRRFGALIQANPSLRAHQSDMMDRSTAVAAAILAERSGLRADDPEPQITATALLGLWRIQFLSLSRYLDGTRTAAQLHQAVTGDVLRAARLIGAGLDSLGPADGRGGERG